MQMSNIIAYDCPGIRTEDTCVTTVSRSTSMYIQPVDENLRRWDWPR